MLYNDIEGAILKAKLNMSLTWHFVIKWQFNWYVKVVLKILIAMLVEICRLAKAPMMVIKAWGVLL